jgi:hypothetical protein
MSDETIDLQGMPYIPLDSENDKMKLRLAHCLVAEITTRIYLIKLTSLSISVSSALSAGFCETNNELDIFSAYSMSANTYRSNIARSPSNYRCKLR